MEVLNTKKHGGFLRNYRVLVDLNGIEPSTARMRTWRSPERYLKRTLLYGGWRVHKKHTVCAANLFNRSMNRFYIYGAGIYIHFKGSRTMVYKFQLHVVLARIG